MSNTSFISTNKKIDESDALRDFCMSWHRVLNRMMVSRGASLSQTKLMALIHREERVRSVDLVKASGFSPRTITEAIDILEREGLVERLADTSDRRIRHIRLTPSGVSEFRRSEQMYRLFDEQLFEVLTLKEKKEFGVIIGRLNNQLHLLEKDS